MKINHHGISLKKCICLKMPFDEGYHFSIGKVYQFLSDDDTYFVLLKKEHFLHFDKDDFFGFFKILSNQNRIASINSPN